MTILVFHQYFSTNKGSYGTRLYEFAKHWVAQGHKVKVVTSVYYKSDLNEERLGKRIMVDGIDVIVLDVLINNKDNFVKRIWHFLLYSFESSYYALTLNYDVVIASSGPITTGIPGLFAKVCRKKKFVFEVRDLWPGVVEEIGFVKSKIVLKLSYMFEKLCYSKADEIVCLSPGMVGNIERRFPNFKPECVYNSASQELFSNVNFAKPDIYKDKNVFLYTGNIGQVNNSILLVKAAKRLAEIGRDDILILVIGDGQLRSELEIYKVNLNLTNLLVLNSIPKLHLIPYIVNATASVIPLMDREILDTSSPNKLYESLMAGVPIIQTTKGWIKEMLEKEDCGLTVSPIDEKELVNGIVDLADNVEKRKRLAQNAKRVALDNFSAKKQASNFLDIMNKCNER